MEKKLGTDLSSGPIAKTLFTFAIPIMLSNLLQTAYSMVDMAIVGQYCGKAGLSAVSIGGNILHLFTFIGMGFATASQIITSQYTGAGKKKELNEMIGTLFSFIVILGLSLTAFCLVFNTQFLKMINCPAEAYKQAYDYCFYSFIGMVLMMGYNMVSAVLRGFGDSKHPMIFISLAAIINVILDYLFIAVFDMNAAGAALATVIAQGTSVVLCLRYLYVNREQFCFDFKKDSFKIRKEHLTVALNLGLPIALQSCAGTISALFVSRYVNGFGVEYSAITGVGSKMESIALIVCNALNTSGAALIGQSFGAGKIDRVKKTVYNVFIYDFIFVSILSVIMLSYPAAIFSIFNKEADVLALAPLYAPVLAIAFMGYSFRSPSLAFINGLGNAKVNAVMGIVEGFVLRIGLTYLLGVILNLGIYGFWYGSTIASYGYALVVFPYFFFGKWMDKNFVVK